MTTAQRRQRAIQLHTEGLSNRAIAKQLNVSHTLINRYISEAKQNGSGNENGNTTAIETKLIKGLGNRTFDVSFIERLFSDGKEQEQVIKILTNAAPNEAKIGVFRVKIIAFSMFRD